MAVHRPIDDRFDDLYTPEPNSGCWLWLGTLTQNGYPRFWGGKGTISAHRFAYERFVGRVPDGLLLDHRCRVRSCVNPAHLEPVTNTENVLRGVGPTAVNARKTHCVAGHPYEGGNLHIRPDGHRRCLACHRISQKKRDAAAKARRRARGIPARGATA